MFHDYFQTTHHFASAEEINSASCQQLSFYSIVFLSCGVFVYKSNQPLEKSVASSCRRRQSLGFVAKWKNQFNVYISCVNLKTDLYWPGLSKLENIDGFWNTTIVNVTFQMLFWYTGSLKRGKSPCLKQVKWYFYLLRKRRFRCAVKTTEVSCVELSALEMAETDKLSATAAIWTEETLW